MTATHHNGRHRRSRRRGQLPRRLATASLAGAAGATGWFLTAHIAEPQAAPAPPPQTVAEPSTPEQIQRTGQVISVSWNSFTTSSPDGQTTTFRITPETAQIAAPAVKSHVVVVGVVHEGIPVATAIADPAAIGPDGPPMDYQLPT